MHVIHVASYPTGRRVWLMGQRVHHGATGAILLAAGLVLMAHDRRDLRVWFSRERPPLDSDGRTL